MTISSLFSTILLAAAFNLFPMGELGWKNTSQGHEITVDEQGTIWIATSSGLVRYENGKWHTYKNNLYTPNLLPSNHITCICEGTGHCLWIGTIQGLSRMGLRSGRLDFIPQKRAFPRVQTLMQGRNGTLWVGMTRGLAWWKNDREGLVRWQDGGWTGSDLEMIGINCILETPDNQLLAGSWKHGLYMLNPSSRHCIKIILPTDVHSVNALCYDPQGHLWIATEEAGLLMGKLTDGKLTLIRRWKRDELPSLHISDILYDWRRGGLWVATQSGVALLKVSKSPSADRMMMHKLTGCNITDISLSTGNVLWLTTDGNGVWTTEKIPGQICQRISRQQLTDKYGGVWTTEPYGVRYQKKNKYHQTRNVLLFPALRIHRLSLSCRGTVLIPVHDAGIYECVQGRIISHWDKQHNPQWIPSNLVHATYEDRQKVLWLVTKLGLGIRYADGTGIIGEKLRHAPKEIRQELYDIYPDTDGSLWLKMQHGVIRVKQPSNTEGVLNYHVYSSDSTNMPIGEPLCMAVDKKGRHWLGSDGSGLCLLDEKEGCFISVHERLSLPEDHVDSISATAEGGLCLVIGTHHITLSPEELSTFHRNPESTGDGVIQRNMISWILNGLLIVLLGIGIWI